MRPDQHFYDQNILFIYRLMISLLSSVSLCTTVAADSPFKYFVEDDATSHVRANE